MPPRERYGDSTLTKPTVPLPSFLIALFPFKKSEVWLLQTCPAIAYGDGGLSQQDLLRRRMVALLSLINYPYWEQSFFNKALFPKSGVFFAPVGRKKLIKSSPLNGNIAFNKFLICNVDNYEKIHS